jgi:hypothetical protein
MRGVRHVPVSYAHLVAEMVAAPVASEAALRNGLDRLDPLLSKATQDLWRRSESGLASQMPAMSIEELVALRNHLWFRDRANTVPLHEYLQGLADNFLDLNARDATPRLPKLWNSIEPTALLSARRLWQWISLALPADLLIAFHPNAHGDEMGVRSLSTPLAQALKDHKFAEVHCHLNAAMDFPTVWSWTLRALADSSMREESLASPGASLAEGREFASWLLRAALGRQAIGLFLRLRGEGYLQTLGQLIEGRQKETGPAKPYMKGRVSETWHARYLLRPEFRIALRDLCRGQLGVPGHFHMLQSIYSDFTGLGAIPWEKWTEPDTPRDPLDREFRHSSVRWSNPEALYMRESLAYLQETGKTDPLFSRVFWQTVKVRCLFYRYVTIRPLSVGMQWFMRFFSRTKPIREKVGWSARLRAALNTAGHKQGLRSLELRLGPPDQVSDGVELLRGLFHGASGIALRASETERSWNASAPTQAQSLEMAFVFHFVRDRGGRMRQGVPSAGWRGSEADPKFLKNQGLRYAHYFREQWRIAQVLCNLLLHYPNSLSLMRGIDVCTDELGIPTWVIKPLFHPVLQSSKEASRHLYSRGHRIPPLRSTAHAGEDFVHLLTGLRRIDEAVEYLACQEGDRIGHGVALGVDPRTWVDEVGLCAMSHEERMFDLLWEWNHYGRSTSMASHGRASYVAREIQQLAEKIFNRRNITPHVMGEFVDYLYSNVHAHLRRPTWEQAFPKTVVGQLIRSYLCDRDVFERCVAPIMIDPREEFEALTALQVALRHKLSTKGIAVEINPSSNLFTGNLADLERHPLWRLRPPRPRPDLLPLDVCIGTDDPIIVNSTLPEEYQRLYDALCQSGLSEAEAWQWLDDARKTGLRYRFSLESAPLDPTPGFPMPTR